MSTAVWRRVLLTLCVVSLAVVAFGMSLIARAGDPGISIARLVGPAVVEPASPAARAGLRTGDRIDLRALSREARYRWSQIVVAGETLEVPVRQGNGVRIVRIVAPPPSPVPLTFWLSEVGMLWIVLFAMLLAWRRADLAEARALVLLFALMTLLVVLSNVWRTPWVRLDLIANAVGSAFDLSVALLAVYAMLFHTERSGIRRFLAYTAYGIAGLGMLHRLALEVAYWFGASGIFALIPSGTGETLQSFTFLVSFLCLAVTVLQLQGAQRARAAWIAVCIGPYYVLAFAVWELDALGAFSPTLRAVLDVFVFLAPFGLLGSLLNRRIFDIGFAVNRAAVFTGVSIVIVGVFVLVEWALSEWYSSASHTTNLAISAALALALGLSVRAIHSRVDRVLDAVFFRKRHEDEQAIRMLAREAAYVTDARMLISRIVATLEEHADASRAEVLPEDVNRYGGISENDAAIVRMRATRAPVDLRDVQTEIAGEFAYPMLARGRLVGVLVLGLKRSGEAYAPDESDAIMQLAHDAGSALDVLLARRTPLPENVLEELRASSAAVLTVLQTLPETIAEAVENVVTRAPADGASSELRAR